MSASRREFVGSALSAAVAAHAGAEAGAADVFFAATPIERVRIGVVGVGLQGTSHVENFVATFGCEIAAVCDVVPEKAERAARIATDAGQRPPRIFARGERDFERLCAETEVDLVFTATPWEWHVPVMLAAMKHGKHAATEVPAAITIDDCWRLVETAEKSRRHCVMMENCCYDRPELMVLRMLREGLFGEAMHAEVGYQHDLRAIKFETKDEGLWRRAHATKRNANFYTTHGLGPAAQAMGVNRGDQFDYIVAMAGNSRGLQDWQREKLGAGDPRRAERYALSDVHTALIRTKLGKTIYLVHDTNLPRPYARYNVFQGTKGIYSGFPPRFYFDGQEPSHRYKPLADFAERWEHPLWKRVGANAGNRGHGGMDYIEDVRLIECLRAGAPTDFDVYDAAAWSCIQELTQRSVSSRSRSLEVPDFTRGRWKSRPPLGVIA